MKKHQKSLRCRLAVKRRVDKEVGGNTDHIVNAIVNALDAKNNAINEEEPITRNERRGSGVNGIESSFRIQGNTTTDVPSQGALVEGNAEYEPECDEASDEEEENAQGSAWVTGVTMVFDGNDWVDAESSPSNEEWTAAAIAAIVYEMPHKLGSALLRVLKDPRCTTAKLPYGSAQGVHNFLAKVHERRKEMEKRMGYEEKEVDLTTCPTISRYKEAAACQELTKFNVKEPLDSIRELLTSRWDEMLWEAREGGGIAEIVDGEWYADELAAAPNGAKVAIVQVAQDKTHLNFKGSRSALPVTLTIGNLPLKERRSRSAWKLVTYAPDANVVIEKIRRTSMVSTSTETQMRAEFHQAWMKTVWEKVIAASHEAIEVNGERVVLRLGPACVDMLEAWNICGLCHRRCVMCKEMHFNETRSLSEMKTKLRNPSDCIGNDHRENIVPALSSWARTNVFEVFGLPDELHNDNLGEVEHVLRAIFGDSNGEGGMFGTEVGKTVNVHVRGYVSACICNQPYYKSGRPPQGALNAQKWTGEEASVIIRRLPTALQALVDEPDPPWKDKRGRRKDASVMTKVKDLAKRCVRVVTAYLQMAQLRRLAVYKKEDIKALHKKTVDYMTLCHATLGKYQRSSFAYPKHHALLHYAYAIQRFGLPGNWDTQAAESNLKFFAKRPGARLRCAGSTTLHRLPGWMDKAEVVEDLNRCERTRPNPPHAQRWPWTGDPFVRGDTTYENVPASEITLTAPERFARFPRAASQFAASLMAYLEEDHGGDDIDMSVVYVSVHNTLEIYMESDGNEATVMHARGCPEYRGGPRHDFVEIRGINEKGEEVSWYARVVLIFVIEDLTSNPHGQPEYRMKKKKEMHTNSNRISQLVYVEYMDRVKDSRNVTSMEVLKKSSGGNEYGVVDARNVMGVAPVEGVCRDGESGECVKWVVNQFLV